MSNCVPCNSVFVLVFLKTMHNETTIRIDFCDIWNNQGLSKCYQPRPSAQLMSFGQTSPLIISGYQKTSSHTIILLFNIKKVK